MVKLVYTQHSKCCGSNPVRVRVPLRPQKNRTMPRNQLPLKTFDWTPNLAYAVGLLVTDGCLSNNGRHIIMRSSEIQQLKNFKKCLKLDNKIGTCHSSGFSSNPSYRVQFGNVQLYRWLESIGLSSKKTFTIGVLDIPDNVFPDFLRGHLDGDGCITSYIDTYNTSKKPQYKYRRIFIRFLSSSETHILWLQNQTNRLFGVKGAIHQKKSRSGKTLWILKFMKKKA